MKTLRKNLKRSLFLSGLALVLLGHFSISEARDWKFHEKEWKDVKVYQKVTIADDSAKEWGPWTEFVEPAAGPIITINLPTVTQPLGRVVIETRDPDSTPEQQDVTPFRRGNPVLPQP